MRLSSSARRRQESLAVYQQWVAALETVDYLEAVLVDVFAALAPFPEASKAAAAAVEARMPDRPATLRRVDHG